MNDSEHDIIDYKVRRAAAINALRKIGEIVAEEQQADAGKAGLLRWFARFGWLVLLCAAAWLAYLMGVI